MAKVKTTLGLLFGLAAASVLVVWQGAAEVGGMVIATGWGLLLLPFAWLPHLIAGAQVWRLAYPPGREPRFRSAAGATWTGRAVSTLLPLTSIGGDVVKARVSTLWGAPVADSVAAVVIDNTVQAASLMLWGAIGLAVLAARAANAELVVLAAGGIVLLGAGVIAFIFLQRSGAVRHAARAAGRLSDKPAWQGLIANATEVDAAIQAVYRARRRIFWATAVMLTGRILITAEIWLAAYFIGAPIGLWEAVMLKSLSMVLRSAAFVVPNGLGIQEGSFLVLGAVLGLDPELMLALSLATRVREVLVSVPGLVLWQHAEGRALWKRAAGRTPEAP